MRALIARLNTRGCAPCAYSLHQLVFHQKSGGMYLLGQQAQGGAAEKEAARTFFLEAVGDQEDRNMVTALKSASNSLGFGSPDSPEKLL